MKDEWNEQNENTRPQNEVTIDKLILPKSM